MAPRADIAMPPALSFPDIRERAASSMPLEILHRPFVLLGRGAAAEGAEIAAPSGPGVLLARIEPVFAGCELSDHGELLCGHLLRQSERQYPVPRCVIADIRPGRIPRASAARRPGRARRGNWSGRAARTVLGRR